MLKAIKIRLYLNNDQIVYTNKLFGTCRFIYNNLLSYKIKKYNDDNHSVNFSELGKKLTELKTEYEWIKDSHSKVLQQSLINLEYAYNAFFKNGSGFPKFKSRRDNKHTCRFPSDAIMGLKGNRINIIRPLSNIHFKCSTKDERYLNKNQKSIRSATLTKTKSGHYYLSILIDKPNTTILQIVDNIIGLDLGIKDFIIDSNGNTYQNIKIKRNNESKLARLHRELSRKVNGSNNKNKCRIKLAKFYDKLNNQKEYYLHSIINEIIDENQVICIENLCVNNMLKNKSLSRSIQELSLFRFKQILKYKCEWYGRDVIEIDRYFPSSKLCNICNYKNTNLTLKDREWKCPKCKNIHDRDINAAINIKNEGYRILNIK